jgi:hypothetical protein
MVPKKSKIMYGLKAMIGTLSSIEDLNHPSSLQKRITLMPSTQIVSGKIIVQNR